MNNQYDPNNQFNQNNQYPNTQYQQQNQYNPNNQYQQNNQYNSNNQYQQYNQYNPNGQNSSSNVDIDELIKKAKTFLLNTPVDKDACDPQDIAQNKDISILSYLLILCWIPFAKNRNSKYIRFHFNQGLILLIAAALAGAISAIPIAVFSMIPLVGPVLSTIISVAVLVLVITGVVVGIYNVCNGRANELPYIGKYRIVKTIPDVAPNSFNNAPPQQGGFNNTPPQNGYNNPPQQIGVNNLPPQKNTSFDVEAYSNGTVNAGFGENADKNYNNQ